MNSDPTTIRPGKKWGRRLNSRLLYVVGSVVMLAVDRVTSRAVCLNRPLSS